MRKRALTVFSLVLFSFLLVGLRTADLMLSVEFADKTVSGKRMDIATLRGSVYDCNMELLTNSEYEIYSAAKPTVKAFEALKNNTVSHSVEAIKERMQKKNPIVIKTEELITDCNDILSVLVPSRYAADSLLCHIIGYTDSSGNGISGIEKYYNSVLSESAKEVYARFLTDANGGVLIGENIEISDSSAPEGGVVLTIDKNIQKIAEKALDESGAECAAAVVIEIESGAIRACVSRPMFNQNDISKSLEDPLSPLINRAFMPFSVGSVFKPVVASAALECGISENFEYNCTGSVILNGVTFNCHKKDGHGVLDMDGAVTNSCNTYFIELALKTGAKNIIEVAEKFAFGIQTKLDEEIFSKSGNLPEYSEIDSKASLANLSFGQGSLTATPVQICSMISTIANNGMFVNPYLVEGIVSSDGNYIGIKNYSENRQIISESTAMKIQKFLLSVIENGSGKRAESKLVICAGKTATAQTGKFKDNEEIYNAWFAGYFPADNPEYSVVILKEDGGEGAVSCAPVFKKIAEEIALNEQ